MEGFPERDEIVTSCSELAYVEFIMMAIGKQWHFPRAGGQVTNWELQLDVANGIKKIAEAEAKKEREWRRSNGY